MKTAIEYLEKAIKLSNKDTFNDLVEVIEVAKKKEYEQLLKAFNYGKYNAITSNDLDEKRTFEWFYKNIKNEI